MSTTICRTSSDDDAGDRAGTSEVSSHVVLNTLYRNHSTALLMYVTRMLSDRQLAEDVVQETMLRAWRHAHTLDLDRGTGWAWLTRVARNIVIDRVRARRARPTEVEELESGECQAKPGNTELGDGVVTELFMTTMLNKLAPAQRSVVYEVYYADRTTADAADALGIPVGTVKSRLHYALRNLKRNIEHERPRVSA